MFAKSGLNKRLNIINLINKYQEIKVSLHIDNNELLLELNKWRIDKTKLDVDQLDDQFINDCIENNSLRIAQDFLVTFNDDFKNLSDDGYETVFEDETDVHFKYFGQIDLTNLTQTSLDTFEAQLIEKLRKGETITNERWGILERYNSNNESISIVNSIKNIRDEVLNSKITLNLELIKRLLPYFVQYDLLNNQNDIFRLVIKNEFLSDPDFIKFLVSKSEHFGKLYKNASQSDKEGFRNLLNEKRENDPLLETLAKSLDIRKTKKK